MRQKDAAASSALSEYSYKGIDVQGKSTHGTLSAMSRATSSGAPERTRELTSLKELNSSTLPEAFMIWIAINQFYTICEGFVPALAQNGAVHRGKGGKRSLHEVEMSIVPIRYFIKSIAIINYIF